MTQKWKQIGNTDYYLGSDRLNFVVAHRIKCKKSKSHPDGTKFVNYTYHPDIPGALKRVFNEVVRLTVTETIGELLQVCDETYAMLKRVLKYDFDGWKTAA